MPGVYLADAAIERPRQPDVVGGVDEDLHPPVSDEIRRNGQLDGDRHVAGVGHPAGDLGSDVRMGELLEPFELLVVGEDDPSERRPVDATRRHRLGPLGGHRCERRAVRLEDGVADPIRFDDDDSLRLEHGGHCALSRADPAADGDTDGAPKGRAGHAGDCTLAGMLATRPAWENRLDRMGSGLFWVSFTAGAVVTLAGGLSAGEILSAVLTGAYVVVMQVAPRRYRNLTMVGELLAIGGVVISLIAISLTGGITSPYVLFAATPTFFASAFLGRRIGFETALLSSLGLIVVLMALDQELLTTQLLQTILLYLLIALTFSQARRILIEEGAKSRAATLRTQRLEAANSLLSSLSELANSAELNPMTVGYAALRDLANAVPISAGEVSMRDDEGSVVVARRGEPDPSSQRLVLPMDVAGRNLGDVVLWAEPGSTLVDHRETIDNAMRPVELAFDNIRLLQQIARRAVAEERTRVARELHDEIGPSLASLGLTIDTLMLQPDVGGHTAHQLEQIRRHVTSLVEEVRGAVSDLRHESVSSIVQHTHRLAAELSSDGPGIDVDINERRPPRGQIATEIAAILTEVVRNAVAHADATLIKVGGYVDRDRGSLVVEDDGVGFDTDARPRGHYGLIGIQERASEAGAKLEIESHRGVGTLVRLSWGS